MYEPAVTKYEELDENQRNLIDYTQNYFADQFDNNEFGPFIEEVSHFNKDRVATLLPAAVGTLKSYVVSPYVASWSHGAFPFGYATGAQALAVAMAVEVIRHYIISYVEQFDSSRVGASNVERRDYLQRWQSVLNDYLQQLERMGKVIARELQDENAMSNTQVLFDYFSYARGGILNVGSPSWERAWGPYWMR